LLWMPNEFVSLSGALSFGAVIGIFFFYKIIHEILSLSPLSSLRIVASQIALTVSAGLFTTPLLIYFFHGFSFSGLLAIFCWFRLRGYSLL